MQLRLAKNCDANVLAEIHKICGAEQNEGFMFTLGKWFLKKYYQILLNEKNSVVIVVENEVGNVVGFFSGTIKAEEHIEAIRRCKIRLLLASLPAIIRRPSLLSEIYLRYKSTGNKGEFVTTSGPRGEYWACLPGENSIGAFAVHKAWLEVMRSLGISVARGEINAMNERSLKAAKLMSADIVKEIVTPAGQKRYIIEYNLVEKRDRKVIKKP